MDNANYTKIYMESVLDGFEGGPYKALHIVQLYGSLPAMHSYKVGGLENHLCGESK